MHEPSEIQCIILVRLQELCVNLRHELLELVLGEHRVIHVMLSVQFDQVGNRDDFFAQGAIASVLLLLVKVGLGRVLIE